jgi:hypothetical protein
MGTFLTGINFMDSDATSKASIFKGSNQSFIESAGRVLVNRQLSVHEATRALSNVTRSTQNSNMGSGRGKVPWETKLEISNPLVSQIGDNKYSAYSDAQRSLPLPAC